MLFRSLHGVSCAIGAGEMTALVGPSGSGKSTTLLCLAGLEPATSGRVALMGRDLAALSPARAAELYRDRVGFVFQAYNLVPYLSVRENIAVSDVLAGRRPDRARVREVLASLGLGARANAVMASAWRTWGVEHLVFAATGTSEDVAMLLADAAGAEFIVALDTDRRAHV